MKRFLKSEEGWVTAFFAVLLPVLLLFSAFGMDYGRAYVLKHQLQSASDAASLAGASAVASRFIIDDFGNIQGERLVIDETIAESRATDIWGQNVVSLKLAEKGVTILEVDYGAFDSTGGSYNDTYYWQVTAKIESALVGPLAGTGNEITVFREAESKVRDPEL